MNKNDFYKELFERYALDEEKIRLNALRQAKTPAWKRAVSTYWKPAAGLAAAAAVTVGVVTYYSAANSPDINITVTQDSALSASQRLYDAEQSYLSTNSEEERVVPLYVTFKSGLSYKDMTVCFSAVHDSQDMIVCAVYLDNGTVLRDPQDIALFAEQHADEKSIKAVKIFTIRSYFRDIKDLSCVSMAELGSDKLNDDTFVPIERSDDDEDPLISDSSIEDIAPVSTTAFMYEITPPTDTSAPAPAVNVSSSSSQSEAPETQTQTQTQTDAPVSSSDSSANDTTRPAETITGDDIERDDDPGEIYSDPDDDEIEQTSAEDTEDPEGDDPDEAETQESTAEHTQTSVQSEPFTPVEEITGGGNSGLMSEFYQLNVDNPLETHLIGDCAIVLTKNAAYFYKLGGVINSLGAKVCETENPKIAYMSASKVVLTGVGQNGQRNILIFLDTASGSVYSSDVGINLGGSEIATIGYSSIFNRYFIKSVSGSDTYIYEVTIDSENGVVFKPLFEFGGVVSVAGCSRDTLWFTASEDGISYSLYSFSYTNGETKLISALGTHCRVKRSLTFESFIISAQDQESDERTSFVFDIDKEKLINTVLDGHAQIACSGGAIYLNIDQKVYILNENGEKLLSPRQDVQFSEQIKTRFEVTGTANGAILIAEKNRFIW